MRSPVIDSCMEWQSMKPSKGEKLVCDEERKILKLPYFFARLSGIYCVNELLERGCPSLPFKIYSVALCVLSLIFSFTGLVSMIWPSFCPLHNRYLRQIQTHDKIIYIMMSVCCTLLRIVIVFKFCSSRWYRQLQRSFISLRDASLLPYGPMVPRRFSIGFRMLVFVMLVAQIILQVNILVPTGASVFTIFTRPTFSIVLLEFVLYSTAWMHSILWVVLLTYGPLKISFDTALDKFRIALKCEDQPLFQVAVVAHDKCCDLLQVVDSLVSVIIGINLMVCVPLFAILGTQVTVLTQLGTSTSPQLFGIFLWCVALVASISMVCMVANTANASAHGPQHLLQRFSSQTCEFNAVVINFMTRFQGTQMGYTFFSFATVTKGSILIAFNLMTSYLLVGVQLKQQTCAANKLQNSTSNTTAVW